MPYPVGPKTETGWPYKCECCGDVFFGRVRADIKYCHDCRPRVNLQQKRDRRRKVRAEDEVQKEAQAGTGQRGGTDYCARMWLTNPGSMCGTRDFCRGCEYAGDGKCCDTEGMCFGTL
jgi:hypothetical protein